MTDQERADIFLRKWKSSMHWVYNDMTECVATWRKWGIIGIPAHTSEAEAMLATDLARDAALHAMLQAQS